MLEGALRNIATSKYLPQGSPFTSMDVGPPKAEDLIALSGDETDPVAIPDLVSLESKASWELFDVGHCGEASIGNDGVEGPQFEKEESTQSLSSSLCIHGEMNKAEKRKQKNRESARRSNERRKRYIRELETMTSLIDEENRELDRLFHVQMKALTDIADQATGHNKELVLLSLQNLRNLFGN